MGVASGALHFPVRQCARRLRIQRLSFAAQYVGLAIYLAYLVAPSILFIPLAQVVFQFGLFDTPLALVLTYPSFLVPFCTWLLIAISNPSV